MRRFLKTHTELFCLKSRNKQTNTQNRANRGRSCSSVNTVTRTCIGCPKFSPPQSIQTSSQAHPLIRKPFLRSQKGRSVELTMHSLLTTRLRMSGDALSLPPIPSWRVYEQNLSLIFSDYISLGKEQSWSDCSSVIPPAATIPNPLYFPYSVCDKWLNEILNMG
jgi:hypothetical protein